MSLLNGTARGALKRGIANNEIDRPKSLCICTRYQRPVVESSFCEMRSWFVLRSRREPLHSGRLWRLRSSVCPRCISGCGGVCVFGSRFAIRLAIRRQYILGKSIQTQNALENRLFCCAVGELPSATGRDNYQSLRPWRASTCTPKPADRNGEMGHFRATVR
jgi:hypothetical protein